MAEISGVLAAVLSSGLSSRNHSGSGQAGDNSVSWIEELVARAKSQDLRSNPSDGRPG